jgi:hypothetical protein
MPLAQDQHAVGELGSDGAHEPFGVTVRPWTTRWDLDRLDAHVGQDGVERGGELACPVADEKPELADPVTEIHHEVADLLGGPFAVRIGGCAEDVDVAGGDFQHEEHVDPLGGERAVGVEDVVGQRRRCLRAQELPVLVENAATGRELWF